MPNTNGRDLTQGSIVKNLLIFAVPYLIANFIQAMYGAVDMAIVGWFADSAGISAVSTGSQVMQIVTCLVSGLTDLIDAGVYKADAVSTSNPT